MFPKLAFFFAWFPNPWPGVLIRLSSRSSQAPGPFLNQADYLSTSWWKIKIFIICWSKLGPRYHIFWYLRLEKSWACTSEWLIHRNSLTPGPLFMHIFVSLFYCFVSSCNYPLYLLRQIVQRQKTLPDQASLCWDSKKAVGCCINSIPSDGTPTPKVCVLYIPLLPTLRCNQWIVEYFLCLSGPVGCKYLMLK